MLRAVPHFFLKLLSVQEDEHKYHLTCTQRFVSVVKALNRAVGSDRRTEAIASVSFSLRDTCFVFNCSHHKRPLNT